MLFRSITSLVGQNVLLRSTKAGIDVARLDNPLDPALGVGQRRQHRMTAIKPYGLVPAGLSFAGARAALARGAVVPGRHGLSIRGFRR